MDTNTKINFCRNVSTKDNSMQRDSKTMCPTPNIPKRTSSKKAWLDPGRSRRKIKTTLDSFLAFPAETPVRKSIGKLGLMWPSGYALSHDAAPLLSAYSEQGCPVDCGPDWSRDQIEILLKRGPHTSAKSKKAMKQLIEETKEKVRNNYARIVKRKDLKNTFPQKLKLSPVARL